MKSILFLLICLFFIHLSSAGIRKKCNKSFTDYKMQQFTETVSRYFSTDKNKPIVFGNSEFKSPSAKRTGSHGTGIPNGSITNGKGQNPIQPIIDKLVSEKKDRKGILRYL
ncbi:MAG: hypothetical protein OXH36_02880, partial [Bdellovibrionales bacterium]|nr:hypothetical protein [Bdellovibrionales bacterium]